MDTVAGGSPAGGLSKVTGRPGKSSSPTVYDMTTATGGLPGEDRSGPASPGRRPGSSGLLRVRSLEADGRGDERATGQRLPQGGDEVGGEPTLDDIPQGAGREGRADVIGVAVDGQEDDPHP